QVMVQAVGRDPAMLPTLDLLPPAAQEPPPRFSPPPEEVESVQTMLRGELPDSSGLILLNPNASDLLPLRRWPAERYVQLARRLAEEYPEVAIAFTGAPNEAAQVSALAHEVGAQRCISLAGKTTLRQLLVLFTLAD